MLLFHLYPFSALRGYPILFLHTKSSAEPLGLGLRDDMFSKAMKFKRTLQKASGSDDPVNYMFLGDLNTMGMKYPYDKEGSESQCVPHSIRRSEAGVGYEITVTYRNTPKTNLRERSPIHMGTFIAQTHGESEAEPDGMTGEYWTSRRERGTLKLSGCVERVYTDYADAHEALA